MKTISFTLLLLLLGATSLKAQDAVDERMYKAYLTDEKPTAAWKEAMAARLAAWKANPSDQNLHFKYCIAQFGLLSSTMRYQDEDLFDEFYKDTEKNLNDIIAIEKKWGEPMALLSATYGLKMGYSPMQGMFLGSKSSSLSEKSRKLSPQSGLVWKVYANSKFFTPEMWGGDLKEAIDAYEKCISVYEADADGLRFNWLYIDALAFMGQAYLKNGDTGKAIATFEKALRIEPEFGWVKHALLPKARSKVPK